MGNKASEVQAGAPISLCAQNNHQPLSHMQSSQNQPKQMLLLRGWRLILLGLILGSTSVSNGLAQSLAEDTGTSVKRVTQGLLERVAFNVNRFQIVGDNPLSEKETQAIVQPYIGENKGIDDIESAADAFEKVLVAKGLSFYRVSFPPQELSDGVIELLVKRYQIGKISVNGNNYYSDRNITASLPTLKAGKSPSTIEIARSLRVANQNSGKRVRVTLAPGEAADEIDAKVVVVDQKPLVLSAWLNNTGTEVSGDYRVGASVAHRNLFGRDHNGSLSFITSPEGIDDVQQFAASYRIPLYRIGSNLSFVAVQSDIDTGSVGGVFDVAGRGEVFGLTFSKVLANVGQYNHGLSVQLNDKLFDNDVQFQGTQLLEDVRSRPLALAYQGSWVNQKGMQFSGSIMASTNLSGGSFNTESSYLASRADASNDWSKFDLGLNFQYSVKEWLYTAAARFAASSDRLITGEQFAVGGTNSIRGMEERELRGDEGYQINLQVWAPEMAKNFRPIVFVDAGRVENNSPVIGEFASETVLSTGILVNWNPTNKISASASYGYLIDGIDSAEPESSLSRDSDSKLHFNLSYRF